MVFFLLISNDHVYAHVLCWNYGNKLHCLCKYKLEKQRTMKTCKQVCQGKEEKVEKCNCKEKLNMKYRVLKGNCNSTQKFVYK